MPIPVSLMMNEMVRWFSKEAVCSTVRVTEPGTDVNFTALPKMLISTCLSFILSPI